MSESLLEQNINPPTDQEYTRWRTLNDWSSTEVDFWIKEQPYQFSLNLKMEREERKVRQNICEILKRCKY